MDGAKGKTQIYRKKAPAELIKEVHIRTANMTKHQLQQRIGKNYKTCKRGMYIRFK